MSIRRARYTLKRFPAEVYQRRFRHWQPQTTALRQGTDILVATPGRLLDLYNQKALRFTQLEVLILDEADRMLDMGFIHDIKKIIALLPRKRQTLLFSATFSQDIHLHQKEKRESRRPDGTHRSWKPLPRPKRITVRC